MTATHTFRANKHNCITIEEARFISYLIRDGQDFDISSNDNNLNYYFEQEPNSTDYTAEIFTGMGSIDIKIQQDNVKIEGYLLMLGCINITIEPYKIMK